MSNIFDFNLNVFFKGDERNNGNERSRGEAIKKEFYDELISKEGSIAKMVYSFNEITHGDFVADIFCIYDGKCSDFFNFHLKAQYRNYLQYDVDSDNENEVREYEQSVRGLLLLFHEIEEEVEWFNNKVKEIGYGND